MRPSDWLEECDISLAKHSLVSDSISDSTVLLLFELKSSSSRWQEAAACFISRYFCLARPIVNEKKFAIDSAIETYNSSTFLATGRHGA